MNWVNDAPRSARRLLTLGMERSESVSKSSVLMRMMLRDAASAGCGSKKATESKGPKSKIATTGIRIVERRVTLQIQSSVQRATLSAR